MKLGQCIIRGCKGGFYVERKLVQDDTTIQAVIVTCAKGHRFFLVDGREPNKFNRLQDARRTK